ncbi:Phosphotransferase enzyme [Scheffersomyces spartinae]|uniref:Altered inheritance of mitochondria protein 9, mitochondrial n=1 Tax=Scheffersomyces spartinae TaxID=45513 RepID=A0A9P7VD26_9ASCO|nr:Phosphotransferase enzyme [Scheffersomyces spartinae]KAG7195577.1 Phosphotransferase enzyme [Scheffersomyces spartinae]
MLKRVLAPRRGVLRVTSTTTARLGSGFIHAQRFQSQTTSSPKEVYTKLSDTKDPQRNEFFQYTWGSWLKNDKAERAKRETCFSIEGVATLLSEITAEVLDSKNVSKSGKYIVKAPKLLKDGTVLLNNNLSLLGLLPGGGNKLGVKSIASIHEGKHHRVYKVTLTTGKELVLRIPYKLESDYAISQKVKSEAATLDFLNLKLGANVPKVVAYGASRDNLLQTPFILMEYISGDLLMKKWNPMSDNEQEVLDVIKPLADFQEKILSIVFNKYGSLYFHDDVSALQQADLPYNGEEDATLKNRWRIGASVEKAFFKNKDKLDKKTIAKYTGPWDSSKPLSLVSAIADIELENVKNRLALHHAEASNVIEDVELLKRKLKSLENFKTMAPLLLNNASTSIMNVEEVFKPRLNVPDLDPLNTIENNGKYYLVDMEYSSIKPFILSAYPSFVAYQGAKIHNLEEDVPGYNEMSDVEKEQFKFMYYKTRNEFMWEKELNARRHDLISIASPHIKALKSPYAQALELKNDKDYLYVEGSMIQLQALWDAYVANELCNATDSTFPIKYSPEYLKEHQADLEDYQMEIVSTPFAATGGWIPQDMFEALKSKGIIKFEDNGDFSIATDEMLAAEEEEAKRLEKEHESHAAPNTKI